MRIVGRVGAIGAYILMQRPVAGPSIFSAISDIRLLKINLYELNLNVLYHKPRGSHQKNSVHWVEKTK